MYTCLHTCTCINNPSIFINPSYIMDMTCDSISFPDCVPVSHPARISPCIVDISQNFDGLVMSANSNMRGINMIQYYENNAHPRNDLHVQV